MFLAQENKITITNTTSEGDSIPELNFKMHPRNSAMDTTKFKIVATCSCCERTVTLRTYCVHPHSDPFQESNCIEHFKVENKKSPISPQQLPTLNTTWAREQTSTVCSTPIVVKQGTGQPEKAKSLYRT
jgi:hypothetical protein